MKTYRDVMKPGENLGWCKPVEFVANGKRVILVINEIRFVGSCSIVGIFLDGSDNYEKTLSAVADYLGITDIDSLSDLHYADGVDSNELGCTDCPWFCNCDAMSEKYGDD